MALRNRWRRQQLPDSLRDEVTPKNTDDRAHGCGRTEISRRLARLADAPFVKVEATKFTEAAMSAATSNRLPVIWSRKPCGSSANGGAQCGPQRGRGGGDRSAARCPDRQGFEHRDSRKLPAHAAEWPSRLPRGRDRCRRSASNLSRSRNWACQVGMINLSNLMGRQWAIRPASGARWVCARRSTN